MIECRYCDEYLTGTEEQHGARCPRCREPLYERPEKVRPAPDPAGEATNFCTVHPRNVAAGACQRCGNFLCGVCRTKWNDRSLCLACLERVLEAREARPEDPRAHRRQAVLSVVFGLAAWLCAAVAALPLLSVQSGAVPENALVLAGMFALLCFVPGLFGVGQGAAAIRARGERMILATCGLILSGSSVGTLLGMFLLSIWRQ
jgi:hypothetical protein